jgi:hypothetical protein
MALQSSGSPISFSQIADEFGVPSGNRLGSYRVTESVGTLSNLPLDTGIPQSGQIKFSNFYSKRLNVVVDFYSGGTETRVNARERYNNNGVRVIGGFRSRPVNSSGIKVFVNVNKTLGSVKNNDYRYVALKTGFWDSSTTLQVDVGGSGAIFGAGGDGGIGGTQAAWFSNNGNPTGNGTPGGNGTSALGIQYSGTTIINNGYIQCGYGGGGGGGFGAGNPDKNRRDFGASGGGGGGGAGFPQGSGGPGGQGGTIPYRPIAAGASGSNASTTVRGLGGAGGSNPSCTGGTGGNGGQNGASAGAGGNGSSIETGSGGAGGSNGVGIVIDSGLSWSYSGSGTLLGGSVNQTVL